MNPNEVLRIVDAIHRDKNIDPEIVFQAIEAAMVTAAKKNYGEDAEIEIAIDRQDGTITGILNGTALDPEETVGRIGAQTAKQVIIQKIREAERDSLYDEYDEMLGQMVGGVVQRAEGGATIVSLGNIEAILPRSEQIPGETHHVNERIRATVFDVKKQGSRVKVILSRTRPQLVQRLFEQEIPEIAEAIIAIEALAREPGYRSKVAVSSSDPRIDCVGACVGVRGNRIKNIVDELSGERIDIVRWNEDMQVLIPNALQPAEVDEVILCKMMGRAIVLVHDDQLSLAIGRRGQNVRLASKLCKWDIEIMTREELEEQIERAVAGYSALDGVSDELAEMLVGEGFLSYDDLSVIEPDDLMSMGDLTAEQVDIIVTQAEERAEAAEQAAATERKRQREQDRIDRATAEETARLEAEAASETSATTSDEDAAKTSDEDAATTSNEDTATTSDEDAVKASDEDTTDEVDDVAETSGPGDDAGVARSEESPPPAADEQGTSPAASPTDEPRVRAEDDAEAAAATDADSQAVENVDAVENMDTEVAENGKTAGISQGSEERADA